jgi:hypothetical protein
MNPIILLDFDGVLNNETDRSLQQSRFSPENCHWIGKLVKETKAKIVISSSWKYLINEKIMTLEGMGYLLLTHGICQPEDVIDKTSNLKDRNEELQEYIQRKQLTNYLVIDDHPLPNIKHKIQTNPVKGFTEADYTLALKLIQKQ